AGAIVYGFDKHDNHLTFAKKHHYIHEEINITKANFLQRFSPLQTTDGADVVFEAVGSNESAELALTVAKPSGRVLILGVFEHNIPINMMQIVKKELTVKGSWTSIFSFEQTIALLKTKSFDTRKIITHRYRFKDTPKAFKEALTDKGQR